MKLTSLASSSKAWRLIQSLIARVLTNGKEVVIGSDDLINASVSAQQSGHPFKVTRQGDTLRFQKGIVTSSSDSVNPSILVIDDSGGITVSGYPSWLVLTMTIVPNPPYPIENPIETYYVVQCGGITGPAVAEINLPVGFLGSYSIVGGSPGDSQITVPIAYITEDYVHQLLKTHISLTIEANHHNLFTFL